MTTRHTQKLWTLSENLNDTQDLPFTEYCIEDGDQEIVLFTRNKRHAELIVKAANSHDALVEEVRKAAGYFAEMAKYVDQTTPQKLSYEKRAAEAKAALKLADAE